jgi:VanZ family protein
MKQGSVQRMWFLLPALVWIAVIFHFSSQPYQEQTIIPELRSKLSEEQVRERMPDITIHYLHSEINAKQQPFHFLEFLFRKSAHLFVYGMLGALLFLALRPFQLRALGRGVIVLEIGAVVAVLDEINQSRSLFRTGVPQDVLIDLAGVVLGMFVAGVVGRKSENR